MCCFVSAVDATAYSATVWLGQDSLKPFLSGANLDKLISNTTNNSNKGREGPSCLCKSPVTFSQCHKRPYPVLEWFRAMFATENYSGHKWKVWYLHFCICQPDRPTLLLVDAVWPRGRSKARINRLVFDAAKWHLDAGGRFNSNEALLFTSNYV